jgi:excinuclease ABC subunit B
MDVIEIGKKPLEEKAKGKKLTHQERDKLIEQLTAEMKEAARTLEFEKAAYLRDRIKDLKTTK